MSVLNFLCLSHLIYNKIGDEFFSSCPINSTNYIFEIVDFSVNEGKTKIRRIHRKIVRSFSLFRYGYCSTSDFFCRVVHFRPFNYSTKETIYLITICSKYFLKWDKFHRFIQQNWRNLKYFRKVCRFTKYCINKVKWSSVHPQFSVHGERSLKKIKIC